MIIVSSAPCIVPDKILESWVDLAPLRHARINPQALRIFQNPALFHSFVLAFLILESSFDLTIAICQIQ